MHMHWHEPTGRARSRWTDLRANRVGGVRGVAHWHPTGVTPQDVSTTAGAAGDDPEARRRGAAARYSDGEFIMHFLQLGFGDALPFWILLEFRTQSRSFCSSVSLSVIQ